MKINRIRTESQKYNEGRSRTQELSQQLLQTLNKEGHGSLAECLDLNQPFSHEVEILVR